MDILPTSRSLHDYQDRVYKCLTSNCTKFYLDTSTLLWLVKTTSQARHEFFKWSNEFHSNSFRIPVWAIHEFTRHTDNNDPTTKKNIDDLVSRTEKSIEQFSRLSTLRAEDSKCREHGFKNRASFLNELAQAKSRFLSFGNMIRASKNEIAEAIDEVKGFIGGKIISSDLDRISTELSNVGEFRYKHLMPPGFQDKKEHNEFGDVIIWKEILADTETWHSLHQEDPPSRHNIVIVTNDFKKDWVSKGLNIIDEDGKTKRPNHIDGLDTTLPHPLLTHELQHKYPNIDLIILQTSNLARILDNGDKKDGKKSRISDWISTISTFESLNERKITQPLQSNTSPTDITPQKELNLDAFSLKKIMRATVADSIDFNDIVEHKCGIQNLVDRVAKSEINEFQFARSLFVICKKHNEIAESLLTIIENTFDVLGPQKANLIVLSLLAQIYFDLSGNAKRVPHKTIGNVLLLLTPDTRYELAFKKIGEILSNDDLHLAYIPGVNQAKVSVEFDKVRNSNTLREIRLNDYPMTEDASSLATQRKISTLLNDEKK